MDPLKFVLVYDIPKACAYKPILFGAYLKSALINALVSIEIYSLPLYRPFFLGKKFIT